MAEIAITDAVAWALLDSAPDGLLLADGDGHILLVNSQVEALFGYDRVDLLGQPVEILLPEALAATHVAHREHFGTHASTRPMGSGLHLVGRRRDGTEIPVDVSLSTLGEAERPWVIAAIRDATGRREQEHEQHDLAVTDEDLRIAQELGDTVLRGLFGAGLRLQGLMPLADDRLRSGLREAVDEIDATIREIRSVIFGLNRD